MKFIPRPEIEGKKGIRTPLCLWEVEICYKFVDCELDNCGAQSGRSAVRYRDHGSVIVTMRSSLCRRSLTFADHVLWFGCLGNESFGDGDGAWRLWNRSGESDSCEKEQQQDDWGDHDGLLDV